MKRKETKASPVADKKRRASVGASIGSPTPLSIEEQRKRAREWYEKERENTSKSRSTTPTSKSRSTTPAKKRRSEEPAPAPEPVVPRSTRKSAAASSTAPTRSKTPTKPSSRTKKVVEQAESDSESSEDVPLPVPTRTKKTPAKAAAKATVPIPKPEPRITIATTSTPKTSTKPTTPARSKTPLLDSSSKKNDSRSSSRAGTPKMQAFESARMRSPVKYADAEEPESTYMTSSSCSTCACDTCGVTVALTLLPLALIGYHDWKIAVTTLVVVVVLATIRRIFRMIIAGEEACADAEDKEE